VLKITPADASFLVIWFGVAGIAGRFFCAWLSDALGRRPSVALVCVMAAISTSLGRYLSGVHCGAVPLFHVMILLSSFFGAAATTPSSGRT